MALYDDLYERLQAHHPSSRVQLAYEHEAELGQLKPNELERIATLLLAASSLELREEYPVFGQTRTNTGQAHSTTYAMGAFA